MRYFNGNWANSPIIFTGYLFIGLTYSPLIDNQYWTLLNRINVKKKQWSLLISYVQKSHAKLVNNTSFFSVRLLSVLCGHSFISSPPQRPMTSDFEGFSNPDFIHCIIFLS